MTYPRTVFLDATEAIDEALFVAEMVGRTAYIIKSGCGWSIVTRRHHSQKLMGQVSHEMFKWRKP